MVCGFTDLHLELKVILFENPLKILQIDWLKKNNFGGAMVWSLDLDDFSGTFCNQGKYPLINTIKSGLGTGQSELNNIFVALPPVP